MTPAALAIAPTPPVARPASPNDQTPADGAFARVLGDSSQRLRSESDVNAPPVKKQASKDARLAADAPAYPPEAADSLSLAPAPADLATQALSWAEHVMARRTLQQSPATATAHSDRGVDASAARQALDVIGSAEGSMTDGAMLRNGDDVAGRLPAEIAGHIDSGHGAAFSALGARIAPAGAAVDRSKPISLRTETTADTASGAFQSALHPQASASAKLGEYLAANAVQTLSAAAGAEAAPADSPDIKATMEAPASGFAQALRDAVTDVVPRTIPVPVGHANWGQAVGQQMVVWSQHAKQGEIKAELRLDPPELGPLRVALHIVDGVTTASFASAHAAVRAALEQAMPQLQQAFSQAGLSLGEAQVNQGDAGGAGQHQGESGGNARQADAGADAGTTLVAEATPARETLGLVDTFA